jgi:hypothetical protein
MKLLISVPGPSLVCGRSVSLLGLQPVGSHLSLPPAGVSAPSTPINKVTSFIEGLMRFHLTELNEKELSFRSHNFQLWIGANGGDSSGGVTVD